MSAVYTKVSDVMVPKVITIDGMATVKEAINTMKSTGVRSLVVGRRDESDEFGLLVISDIAKKVMAVDRAPERVNVYEIMSKPVLTLPAAMNIKYAVRLLVQFDLSRALVVNDAREPVGIITVRDLVLEHFIAEGT
ncbi:MAG: CBS domain-containing protein [Rhodospirillales bacterium]|nr:CBS domain-containing protein [Rhodospirillales bacterium]